MEPMKRAALGLALASLCGAAWAGDALETGVKATYLYKFAPFVEWPANAFPSPESPITICVVGADPFGAALDEVAQRQRVGGRPLAVRHLASVARDSGCQIAYLDDAQAPAALHGEPVLTVTDGAAEGAHGIVNFVIKEGRVRFTIDNRAAEESHIDISSKLLSLAVGPK
jgi:YfiR/HmsC-like